MRPKPASSGANCEADLVGRFRYLSLFSNVNIEQFFIQAPSNSSINQSKFVFFGENTSENDVCPFNNI